MLNESFWDWVEIGSVSSPSIHLFLWKRQDILQDSIHACNLPSHFISITSSWFHKMFVNLFDFLLSFFFLFNFTNISLYWAICLNLISASLHSSLKYFKRWVHSIRFNLIYFLLKTFVAIYQIFYFSLDFCVEHSIQHLFIKLNKTLWLEDILTYFSIKQWLRFRSFEIRLRKKNCKKIVLRHKLTKNQFEISYWVLIIYNLFWHWNRILQT